MTSRRLSQAISEGDGISVIADVDGPDSARAAEAAGAEAIMVVGAARAGLAAIREATELPIVLFWDEDGTDILGSADACIVDVRDDDRERLERLGTELGERIELAPRICTDEHLAFVLDTLDPEILVLGARGDGEEPLTVALELLPDVPAGKLAIADVGARSRDELDELERAGVDAVIVATGEIAHLVGAPPPEV
jgi:NAD(P)H-dependent flavin oxidoreductase YrpB (nitropropane dioxygenase family)